MQGQLQKIKSCVDQGRIEDGLAAVQEVKVARLTQPVGTVSDADYMTALEGAVLLSIAAEDVECMGRHMKQLLALTPTPSTHMRGLHLMALLIQNADAEFHAQLELLGDTQQDVFLSFPITLERKLMVGMYDQILDVKVPHPSFQYFLEYLKANTVREAICDNLEVCYDKLSIKEAAALIGTDNLEAYIEEERADWIVENGTITFQVSASNQDEISADKWIQQTLFYADQMEQIV
jgi:CSN8/PSMD8/EIF3K family